MEDTEKSSPSVETEFNGNEIFLFVYSKYGLPAKAKSIKITAIKRHKPCR